MEFYTYLVVSPVIYYFVTFILDGGIALLCGGVLVTEKHVLSGNILKINMFFLSNYAFYSIFFSVAESYFKLPAFF